LEGMKYFYELFESLPRGGPGTNEYTRRAFNAIPKKLENPFILDIGCGSGVQTIELAKISNGQIIALDNHQPFLAKLMNTARAEGLAEKIITQNISMFDMDFKENTFDIVWSEGALYFMGFQNGLRRCHQLLKEYGYLAVTEAVYITPNPPAPVTQFFEKEYPYIKDVKRNIALIKNEGYRLLSNFTLPESAWLDSYYRPMEKELSRLTKKYRKNNIALGIFNECRDEIAFYKKYSKYYGYEFFVMQKAG
jgi:SAM-dependent methyltransferase